MNKMVRKQLFITAEQNRRIKSRAAVTGLSEGEVIRRGINRELDEQSRNRGGQLEGCLASSFRYVERPRRHRGILC